VHASNPRRGVDESLGRGVSNSGKYVGGPNSTM
jgi:hypothetical protein